MQGAKNLATAHPAIFQGGVRRHVLRRLAERIAPAPVAVGRDRRPWTRSWQLSYDRRARVRLDRHRRHDRWQIEADRSGEGVGPRLLLPLVGVIHGEGRILELHDAERPALAPGRLHFLSVLHVGTGLGGPKEVGKVGKVLRRDTILGIGAEPTFAQPNLAATDTRRRNVLGAPTCCRIEQRPERRRTIRGTTDRAAASAWLASHWRRKRKATVECARVTSGKVALLGLLRKRSPSEHSERLKIGWVGEAVNQTTGGTRWGPRSGH